MARKTLFQIIEPHQKENTIEKSYDVLMFLTIIVSLIPLTTKSHTGIFMWLDFVSTIIFIIDYLLRLLTADYKLEKGKLSFFLYPFTFLALADLLCILPSLFLLNNSLRLFKILRMLRILRVFKFIRYSKNVQILTNVLKKQKDSLIIVGLLALGYIFISALIIFNVEPSTFPTFFDALYWATISLTTVGYGDIYAVSTTGKIITMISSFLGIAIVALPAGIITAGYMKEIKEL
ncbi:Cyclic nucleotide-gated potassium channel [Streptococcus cristatus]|uniref:Cyclic nucleotide-gated potassium channel n=1 Tax=Streptococcus cristatus TaxID=45634 RepID=A0A428GWM7_STRCR|nr:ion transporter [Streptococcus cristatus]MBC6976538.1 ion transporter [Streptococcus cristatus]RSJ80932.1 Cyclic nucleotide-gated potassium channel [Streptococcus cristatus]RSJ82332.1 Cyclic nucleotide-gated potassium channel [Streptococcus cristatus]RSJ87535.1 Cyclic nucleotide-gated potassium channel [Streptococcus cristatus]RSJ88001.1 Cyclic nucleotide-gated potassium channel [Streptococcus cristatus]